MAVEVIVYYPPIAISEVANTVYRQLKETSRYVRTIWCQIWWKGLDAFDAKVKLGVRQNPDAPYVDVPGLEFIMDNFDGIGGGSCIFKYEQYEGLSIAVNIHKGSATTGEILINTELYTTDI